MAAQSSVRVTAVLTARIASGNANSDSMHQTGIPWNAIAAALSQMKGNRSSKTYNNADAGDPMSMLNVLILARASVRMSRQLLA